MERDLRKIRAKRAEKEKAAGILTRPAGITKERGPRIDQKKSPPTLDKDAVLKSEEAEHTQQSQLTDRVKSNGEADQKGLQVEEIAPRTESLTFNESNMIDPQAATVVTQSPEMDPSAGLAINLQPDDTREPTLKLQEPTNLNSQPPSNASGDFQITDHQEAAPFESMFNDLENPSNPTSLDFDLGFPSSGPDLLNDAAFENMIPSTSNNDQTLNLPPATAEDIDSLLPGLDNYVNDGADFSMLDMNIPATATLPDASASITNTSAPAPDPNSTNEGLQQMDSAPMESNFDDLFGGSGDWGMDDDMGGGTMGDFDEDWFKTDG